MKTSISKSRNVTSDLELHYVMTNVVPVIFQIANNTDPEWLICIPDQGSFDL